MKKTLNRVKTVKKNAKLSSGVIWDRFKLSLEVVKVLLTLHGLHWF